MNTFRKSVLLAGMTALALATPALAAKDKDKDKAPAPVAAAPAAGITAPTAGIAVADVEVVVEAAQASVEAEKQRQTYYKATLDSYQSRAQQLQAQIDGLVAKYEKDAKVPTANKVALKAQEDAIEKLQKSGQNDLNRIIAPVVFSREYVKEQVLAKLDDAVKAAMAKKNVTLLLSPQVVVLNTSAANDLTLGIVQELNVLLPSVQFIPPPGWEPAQLRRLRAQQAAQGGAPLPAAPGAPAPVAAGPGPVAPAPAPVAPAPRPAGPQPEGR